jgi:shikimate dehydrogenase
VAVIPLLDGLEPSAEISGACNTVVRQPDGRLIGSNTDGTGFVWAIRDEGIDPAGLEVVLLGAGGAARAVSVKLAMAGARHVTIANRTPSKRDELVALLHEKTPVAATSLSWEGTLVVPTCDVLVDCTPVGMGTGASAEELVQVDLSGLSPETVVCDLNPERADTAFLRFAREHDHKTLGGLGMLARQGAAGFKAWTGVDAPLDVMETALAG